MKEKGEEGLHPSPKTIITPTCLEDCTSYLKGPSFPSEGLLP